MKNVLTNRTLTTFEKWYFETHCKSSIKFDDLLPHQYYDVFDWLYSQCETIQYAFAVEFFDSIGIYVKIDFSYIMGNRFKSSVVADKIYSKNWFITRKEATSQALEKANEIFNNRL